MAGNVALSQAMSYARDLRSAYQAAVSREQDLADANDRLRKGYQQSLQYAAELKKTYRQLQRAILQSLLGLASALEAKDAYTAGHSTRVADLARRIALAVGLTRVAAETIAQAGLLHDLGKIGIPERILAKPGPLAPEEWAVMQRHPLISAQIVAPLEFFDQGAVIVRHHHERWDGSGYPDGLQGDLIPLGSRIVAVADVWDALTSDRPYRQRLPLDEARRELAAQAGRTLDARLVTTCLDLLDRDAEGD
jgi:HD-GYP domain-containing protein (c-di-GMP phosphodiesterase class II)